jgi:hypothetical protein
MAGMHAQSKTIWLFEIFICKVLMTHNWKIYKKETFFLFAKQKFPAR